MTEPAAAPLERRASDRVPVAFPVILDRLETLRVEVGAANISATGMLVRSGVSLPVWARFTAELPTAGRRDVRIVRRDGDAYGCLFQTPLSAEELAAVLKSHEAQAGFERLKVVAAPPPPPEPRRIMRLWRR